ncbi:pwwp domain protein, partial [Ichthyophthirius multifiliis]
TSLWFQNKTDQLIIEVQIDINIVLNLQFLMKKKKYKNQRFNQMKQNNEKKIQIITNKNKMSSQKAIKKNQVVWAKLKGYPWWPSFVQFVGKQEIIVNFLGENSHATLKFDQVQDFKQYYNQNVKGMNIKNKKLINAIYAGQRIIEGKSTFEQEQKNVIDKNNNQVFFLLFSNKHQKILNRIKKILIILLNQLLRISICILLLIKQVLQQLKIFKIKKKAIKSKLKKIKLKNLNIQITQKLDKKHTANFKIKIKAKKITKKIKQNFKYQMKIQTFLT